MTAAERRAAIRQAAAVDRAEREHHDRQEAIRAVIDDKPHSARWAFAITRDAFADARRKRQ